MHAVAPKLVPHLATSSTPMLAIAALVCCTGHPTSPSGNVVAIEVTPAEAVVQIGARRRFTAMGLSPSGAPVEMETIWTASGGVIDSVGEFLAGDQPGTYHIVATHPQNLWIQDSAVVVISDNVGVALRIHPRRLTIGTGHDATFVAYAFDGTGDSTLADVSWEASSGSFLSGSGKGLGHYKSDKPGRSTIRARSGSAVDSVTVTVTDTAVASITLIPALDTLPVAQLRKLDAVLRDSSGRILSERQVLWTAGQANVATVDQEGYVHAVTPGVAMVEAWCEGVADTARIVVVDGPSTGDAAPIFTETFLSGDLSHSEGGVRWSGAAGGAVVDDRAMVGSHAWRATWPAAPGPPNPPLQELDWSRSSETSELWLEWYVRFSDGGDGFGAFDDTQSGNKKFFRLKYGDDNLLGASYQPPITDAGNFTRIYPEASIAGEGMSAQVMTDGGRFPTGFDLADSLRGSWIQIRVHARMPSGIGIADGVLEMWINGTLRVSRRNLNIRVPGSEAFDNGYFLGATNGGFSVACAAWIDGFRFYDTDPGW